MIKLNLIFIAMDLLTLLFYPVIYLHGRMFRFFEAKGNRVPVKLPLPVFAALDE
jgi:hypothetical protein